MKFEKEKISFLSSDGIHTLNGVFYVPEAKPRAVLQISHGMSDHIERYGELAAHLAERGFAVAGHNHLGHGEGAETLGFFAPRGGADLVVRDMHLMNEIIRARFADTPVFVLGHSMGSYIARIFAVEYANDADGLIIHASSGPIPAARFGRVLARLNMLFFGKKNRSAFLKYLTSHKSNARFPKEEGENAWLTRDKEHARAKLADPFGHFDFTASGYFDLFTFVLRSNSKRWFDSYPKDLPTLIVSGTHDPLGGFGEGVMRVRDELLKRGCRRVSFKLYDGARHELFGEINKREVFEDIEKWLGGAEI